MRAKISRNLLTKDNMNGCLKGCIDDYLESFEAQGARMKAKLAQTRDEWARQSNAEIEYLTQRSADIRAHCKQLQQSVAMLFAPPVELQVVRLQPLGQAHKVLFPDEEKNTFHWTLEEEIQKRGLVDIPRLVAIRTKGGHNDVISALQFDFEGGIRSPMIDSHRPNARDEVRHEELKGSPVTKIATVACEQFGFIDMMHLEYADGQTQLIFDKGRA